MSMTSSVERTDMDFKISVALPTMIVFLEKNGKSSLRYHRIPTNLFPYPTYLCFSTEIGERGGSVVECQTPEREVVGSKPTAAVLCPWARHFTPRKYWLITQEAVAPSRHDWKIVDWDIKPQHKQTKNSIEISKIWLGLHDQHFSTMFVCLLMLLLHEQS